MAKDEVEKPQVTLGVSKSVDCDNFPFSNMTLLVGRQKGHFNMYQCISGTLLCSVFILM